MTWHTRAALGWIYEMLMSLSLLDYNNHVLKATSCPTKYTCTYTPTIGTQGGGGGGGGVMLGWAGYISHPLFIALYGDVFLVTSKWPCPRVSQCGFTFKVKGSSFENVQHFRVKRSFRAQPMLINLIAFFLRQSRIFEKASVCIFPMHIPPSF